SSSSSTGRPIIRSSSSSSSSTARSIGTTSTVAKPSSSSSSAVDPSSAALTSSSSSSGNGYVGPLNDAAVNQWTTVDIGTHLFYTIIGAGALVVLIVGFIMYKCGVKSATAAHTKSFPTKFASI